MGRARGILAVAVAAIAVGLLAPATAGAVTFTATQSADALDPAPDDGVCDVNGAAAGTPCSLRGAFQTAAGSHATTTGADVVEAPIALSPYPISLGQMQSFGNGALTIRGTGGTGTDRAVIDANNSSRILDVLGVGLTLERVTLSEGSVSGANLGGAIQFSGSPTAALTLTNSRIENGKALGNNISDGLGGAIFASGLSPTAPLTITGSEIAGNQAGNGTDGSGVGGGLYLQGANPTVTVTNSQITGNTATGEAGSDSPGGSAGGVSLRETDGDSTPGLLSLTNSQVTGNVAGPGVNPIAVNGGDSLSSAGGIFLGALEAAPALTVNGGSISNNRAGGGTIDALSRRGIGGAVWSQEGDADSDISLTGVTMTGNSAGGGSGTGHGIGGAISTSNDVSIVGSTVDQNTAGVGAGVASGNAGGALFVETDADYTDASLTVANSSVSQNVSGEPPTSSQGGGIAQVSNGPLAISDSQLSSNQAGQSGGAIARLRPAVAGGNDTILRSTLAGNDAGQSGGAIDLTSPGTMVVNRSTISGNDAGPAAFLSARGGGISASGAPTVGTLQVTSSTVSGNTATGSGGSSRGGGIATGTFGAENLDVQRSTIAGNTAAGTPGDSLGGNISTTTSGPIYAVTFEASIVADGDADAGSQNCSLVGGPPSVTAGGNVEDTSPSQCGLVAPGDRIGQDPGLLPLANNGGPTQTRAPAPNGPAVDFVTGAAFCPPGGMDQRGFARPSPAGGNCDSGALELQDPDGDGVYESADGCPNQAGPASNGGCPVSDGGGGTPTPTPLLPTPAIVDPCPELRDRLARAKKRLKQARKADKPTKKKRKKVRRLKRELAANGC